MHSVNYNKILDTTEIKNCNNKSQKQKKRNFSGRLEPWTCT